MTPGITVTGADEQTPRRHLRDLVDAGAEVGVLLTFDPDGRPRYPCLAWVQETLAELPGRCALHLCGGRIRLAFHQGLLDPLLPLARRVQVNGLLFEAELRAFRDRLGATEIITQHTPRNAHLVGADVPGHALLVDGSGGRGLRPDKWERPDTPKPVGFAGGLGPDSLAQELPKIAAAARDGWWVDMEGRLRDGGDWFDARRAMEAVSVFRALLEVLR